MDIMNIAFARKVIGWKISDADSWLELKPKRDWKEYLCKAEINVNLVECFKRCLFILFM